MKKFILSVISLTLLTSNAFTDETPAKNMAVGAKVSTLGLGIEAVKPVGKVDLRLGINQATYSADGTIDGADYKADLDAQTVSALADWHPAKNGFFVSGGLMLNDNKLAGTATANGTKTIKIGDADKPISSGTVTTSISFDDVSPYTGIGYRHAIEGKKSWGFTSELGVLYQGSSEIGLAIDDATKASAGITDTDIAQEEAKMRDDVKDFKYYPVASIGLVYNF